MGLGGAVTLRVVRDARGRYLSGDITARQLTSTALPPGTPIPMFDHLLAGPSMARARKLTNEQAAAAAPGASAATAGSGSIQFTWRTE